LLGGGWTSEAGRSHVDPRRLRGEQRHTLGIEARALSLADRQGPIGADHAPPRHLVAARVQNATREARRPWGQIAIRPHEAGGNRAHRGEDLIGCPTRHQARHARRDFEADAELAAASYGFGLDVVAPVLRYRYTQRMRERSSRSRAASRCAIHAA
jgi:hypothetical protein